MCFKGQNKMGVCILFIGLLMGCQDDKRVALVSGQKYLIPEEYFLFKPPLVDRLIGFDDDTDLITLDISTQLDAIQGEQILLTLFSAGTKVPLPASYERYEDFEVEPQYRKAFRKYESYKWDVLDGDTLVADCIVLNKKISCHYNGEGLFDEFSAGVYVSFPEQLWSSRVVISNVAKELLTRWKVE